jgi:hypothetical protein
MTSYYVDTVARTTGEHEVHRFGCPHAPPEERRRELGEFLLCRMALSDAAGRFAQVNGCARCIPECHTAPVAIDASAA